jgi:hypothetical protein
MVTESVQVYRYLPRHSRKYAPEPAPGTRTPQPRNRRDNPQYRQLFLAGLGDHDGGNWAGLLYPCRPGRNSPAFRMANDTGSSAFRRVSTTADDLSENRAFQTPRGVERGVSAVLQFCLRNVISNVRWGGLSPNFTSPVSSHSPLSFKRITKRTSAGPAL